MHWKNNIMICDHNLVWPFTVDYIEQTRTRWFTYFSVSNVQYIGVMHKCASNLTKPESYKTAIHYLCLRCLGMAAGLWTYMIHRGQWPYWEILVFVLRQRQSHINCRVSELSVRPHKLAGCGDSWCWLTNKIQEVISLGFVMPEHCTCLHRLDIVCTVSSWSVYIFHLTNHITDFSEIWCVKFKFPHREMLRTSHIPHFRTITLTSHTAQICLVLCQFLNQ